MQCREIERSIKLIMMNSLEEFVKNLVITAISVMLNAKGLIIPIKIYIYIILQNRKKNKIFSRKKASFFSFL